MSTKKHLAILGSSGSIGTQALEVVAANKDLFEVEVLTVGSNAALLIEQARLFHPNMVVIADTSKYEMVKSALQDLPIKVYSGAEAIEQVVQTETIDLVLTAMVGYAGLGPTIKAIEAGKNIALANKETLVVAGELITQLARAKKVNIYPVDSEHSAIFQCLAGEWENKIEKIYLTASGGPFRGKTEADLAQVTKAQALKHPNWTMGAKITIDSATLMNKGLEVIEAKWLFNLTASQIDVIVHPQSIIHSIVQFEDGSMKAQMGLPDMKLPIQYAFTYPERIQNTFPRFDFMNHPELTFSAPDKKTFRCLDIAFRAMAEGGNRACVLNAANEVAVEAFLKDRIGFLQIPELIEHTLTKIENITHPDLAALVDTNTRSRVLAEEWLLR
jgi:1-deoxy-D-xylulose-5-phosphate reductoisomerase